MAEGGAQVKKKKLYSVYRNPYDECGLIIDVTLIERVNRIFITLDQNPQASSGDLNAHRGWVEFVTSKGRRYSGGIIKTWFPPGNWTWWPVSTTEHNNNFSDIEATVELASTDLVEQSVLDSFMQRVRSGIKLLQWHMEDVGQFRELFSMLDSSLEAPILVHVEYGQNNGNRQIRSHQSSIAGDQSLLSNEKLARICLQFVEHFGNVQVDHSLAEGGLTADEIEKVKKPNPEVVTNIIDLFTQGYIEFQQVQNSVTPASNLDEFKAMEEAIFYQARAGNNLAKRNLLMIGLGRILNVTNGTSKDIGVHRRPCTSGEICEVNPSDLLYDRHGVAVYDYRLRPVDMEYRSVDMEKLGREAVFPVPTSSELLIGHGIPIFYINIDNPKIYECLRRIEQDLASPPREIMAMAFSIYNNCVWIAQELERQHALDVIGERTITFAAMAILFFVIHAWIAFLSATNPLLGLTLIAIATAAGVLMGVDIVLTDIENMTLAGRHFAQIERLHRTNASANGGNTGKYYVDLPKIEKAELTKLSESHLKDGSVALLQAMADFFALGVMITGGEAVSLLGSVTAGNLLAKAISDGAAKSAGTARSAITVLENLIVKVKSLKGRSKPGMEIPKEREVAGAHGKVTGKEAEGAVGSDTSSEYLIQEPGPHLTEPMKGAESLGTAVNSRFGGGGKPWPKVSSTTLSKVLQLAEQEGVVWPEGTRFIEVSDKQLRMRAELHGHPNPSGVEAMYSWRPRQGTVGWDDFVTRKMKGDEEGGPVVSVRSSALSNEARALNTIAHESYELSGLEEALGNSRMSVEKVCKIRDEMHFEANDYADDLTTRKYERLEKATEVSK